MIARVNAKTAGQTLKDKTPAEIADDLARQPTEGAVNAEHIADARTDGSTTLLELVAPYTEEERGTWPTQQAEAEAWRLDDKAPCIMLRRMAYHRGISMQVMTDKVMENVEVFEYVAGDILGVQQKTIDDIEGA